MFVLTEYLFVTERGGCLQRHGQWTDGSFDLLTLFNHGDPSEFSNDWGKLEIKVRAECMRESNTLVVIHNCECYRNREPHITALLVCCGYGVWCLSCQRERSGNHRISGFHDKMDKSKCVVFNRGCLDGR